MTPLQEKSQEKLLVVDDDENNRDMLARRLARHGYSIDVAEDGPSALEKINAAHYDLVLLDQMMPGMSGLDLLRLLRATYSQSDLPVIMVTAVDHSDTVVEALHGGANDYVMKPVDMPVITARIEAQLSRSRTERTIRDNEQRYELAARSSHDGFWEVNLVTGKVFVAPAWIQRLGYSADDIGSGLDSWFSLLHPDEVARVRGEFTALAENRAAEFHSEFRLRTKAGRSVWTLARGAVQRSPEGTPIRVAGSFTDLDSSKFTDALTGLGNRPMLFDRLSELASDKSSDAGLRFGLLLLDLDGFKQINDSMGNRAGDRILMEIAHRIESAVRESVFSGALVCRIGGDEFSIVLPAIPPDASAVALSRDILVRLCRPILFEGLEMITTASLGVVTGKAGNDKPEDLLRDAELAMYEAKRLGKNRCQSFDPELRERVGARTALIRDLARAVERHQLVAFYQAKVDLKTRSLAGFEALLRWRHPERGLMSPLDFIPLAEESGFIIEIGQWILYEAARQLATWQRTHPQSAPLSMNVNLSVKQLVDPLLPSRIQAILRETGIAPGTLKLELTESALMTDLDFARGVLSELRDLGVGLKLDDFGTGYSSLSYLRALHFDSLKIDKSFVDKLVVDPETHAIVETIIRLAHTLGMKVVAEGIEDPAQLDELMKLGCDVGQGYYFSRPVDAEAAGQLWVSNIPTASWPDDSSGLHGSLSAC